MINSYDSKLEQSGQVTTAVQDSPRHTPINKLPPELLATIFRFIIDGLPRRLLNYNRPEELPIYPDILSHICSKWRKIALELPILWTDIQLSLSSTTWKCFLAHAELFLSRANQLPLNVCINDNLDGTEDELHNRDFLSKIAPRTRSLEFYTHCRPDPAHNSLPQSFLPNATPGVLIEMTLLDIGDYYPPTFLLGTNCGLPQGTDDIILPILNHDLESLWLYVTILRLGWMYPYWSSKAYHGLVELHLIAWGLDPLSISIPELTSILKSSAGLRVLYIDLLLPGRNCYLKLVIFLFILSTSKF